MIETISVIVTAITILIAVYEIYDRNKEKIRKRALEKEAHKSIMRQTKKKALGFQDCLSEAVSQN